MNLNEIIDFINLERTTIKEFYLKGVYSTLALHRAVSS